MEAMTATATVLVGLIVGSFLNVVILRLPQGSFRSAGSRSHCPKCGELIRAKDNIPVLSYLLLRGRARCCKSSIHWRYPVIELLTAFAFFLLYLFHAPLTDGYVPQLPTLARLAVDACFVSAILAASVIDLEHRILPDAINYPGLVCGLAISLLMPGLHSGDWVSASGALANAPMASLIDAALGAGIGAGAIYSIALVGKLVYRTEAMGLGDVKFMAFTGAFVGPQSVLLAMLLAVLVGAVLGLIAALRSGDPRTPFGPFLAIGVLAVHFYEQVVQKALLEDFPLWLQTSPYGLPVMLLVCVLSIVALLLLRRIRLDAGDDDSEYDAPE